MAEVIKPPTPLPEFPEFAEHGVRVFLGGSIEQGKAEDWQDRITKELQGLDVTIFNPRRDNWDSTWDQDPTPGTKFHEQVQWELDAQNRSEILVYYFCPGTQSPITLLELGLFIEEDPMVFCPKDFWRYGNVKMVCDRYGVFLYEDETDFIYNLKVRIKEYDEKGYW